MDDNKTYLFENFENACRTVGVEDRERSTIGTLGEKSLHLILKHTFEPRPEFHEIKVGRFFADIKNEKGVTEIQTRSFNALRKKLDVFLNDGEVRIIYPIAGKKQIVWIDMDSGEITLPRKSPKTGSFYDCFKELYKIKWYLDNKNLTFTPVIVDMIEYRNLNGWSSDKKKGSSRYDRVPVKLTDFIDINGREDYKKLIPENLPKPFTVKEFAKEAKITKNTASKAVNILKYLGVITMWGKRGREYLYLESGNITLDNGDNLIYN